MNLIKSIQKEFIKEMIDMFREVARVKQKLSDEECMEILKSEPRGVLSLIGDDDYPYGMPMNFLYIPEDNAIYFPGGKKGHKIDAIMKNNKASFCTYDSGFKRPGEWSLNIKSVIAFGRIEMIDDMGETERISRLLSYKFTDDEDYIEAEIEHDLKRTLCFALKIEHLTGKIVNES